MDHNIPLYNIVISKWVIKKKKVREGGRRKRFEKAFYGRVRGGVTFLLVTKNKVTLLFYSKTL